MKTATLIGCLLAGSAMIASGVAVSASKADPLAGSELYADVKRYAALGLHRYGYAADDKTTAWIAQALERAGFATELQPFSLGRQYVLDDARVEVGGATLPALPLWWIPPAQASFSLSAPLVASGNARGKLVWLKLPYDRRAYLDDAHRTAITAAAARGPAAIILTIDNPADDIFTYNAAQDDAPWPVPVIVVAAKHRDLLAAAEQAGSSIAITVKGSYVSDVPGRNVVARLDRGAKRTVVVSTPLTGWFVSACERGPGIANFLALARWVAAQKLDANFIFVATTGHEIGHGGMEVFLRHGAPPRDEALAWVHFGASNACYEWEKTADGWRPTGRVDAAMRLLVQSPSMVKPLKAAFANVQTLPMVADKTAVGELREVKAAGYRDFFGMAGPHRFFHTPNDTVEGTGPEILEPVARAFARAVKDIIEQAQPAQR